MDQATTTINPTERATDEAAILSGYGCGTLRFAGAPDALYERHLKFDNVVEPESADQRERYEAAGRAVRDIPRTAGCAPTRPTREKIRNASITSRSSS